MTNFQRHVSDTLRELAGATEGYLVVPAVLKRLIDLCGHVDKLREEATSGLDEDGAVSLAHILPSDDKVVVTVEVPIFDEFSGEGSAIQLSFQCADEVSFGHTHDEVEKEAGVTISFAVHGLWVAV